MTEKRQTYRHRNTKNHWTVAEKIHTFWVGQRVARSWERVNYHDVAGEIGTVVALPILRGGNLIVQLEEKEELVEWGPTECIPVRRMLEGNRNRFKKIAKGLQDKLNRLDENGHEIG